MAATGGKKLFEEARHCHQVKAAESTTAACNLEDRLGQFRRGLEQSCGVCRLPRNQTRLRLFFDGQRTLTFIQGGVTERKRRCNWPTARNELRVEAVHVRLPNCAETSQREWYRQQTRTSNICRRRHRQLHLPSILEKLLDGRITSS